MVKMVNFTSRLFYHDKNKNNKKLSEPYSVPGTRTQQQPPLRGSNQSEVTGATGKAKQGEGRRSCSVRGGQESLSEEVTMEQRK